jgi:hypothetical protein
LSESFGSWMGWKQHDKMTKWEEGMTDNNIRDRHHSRILCISLDRTSLTSGNVRWNCQASSRLDSANATVYMSMSMGSVNNGLAVRTYLRISGVASSDREMACKILDG